MSVSEPFSAMRLPTVRAPSRARSRSFVRWIAGICLTLVVAAAATLVAGNVLGGTDAPPTYVARDTELRAPGIYLYASSPDASTPRAVVFFLGNDVGFWNPHRRMASVFAKAGFAVAGIDIRPLLEHLPTDSAQRADSLGRRIGHLAQRVYNEFAFGPPAAMSTSSDVPCATPSANAANPRASGSIPFIVAGHSLGAELAIWTAANVSLPALRGVMAISPGSRSHLTIAASDLLMTGEPTEPGSFSVASEISTVLARHRAARIAIVRGMRDGLASVDPMLVAAGGSATRRFEVPFIGHSMKQVAVATPIVGRALAWLSRDE